MVPEFMWKPLRNERGKMLGIRAGGEEMWGQLLQKGLRERLLCEECDNRLLNQRYEQPSESSWSTLSGLRETPSITIEGIRVSKPDPSDRSDLVRVRGLDYPRFKLFLLSLLWRASASSLPEYHQVQLGPHEETLRRMLLCADPGNRASYPIILYVLRDQFLSMPYPVRQRFGSTQGYRFFLPPRVLLWYLVASHFDRNYLRATLSESGEWIGFLLDSRELGEYRWAEEVVRIARVSDRMLQ